MVVILRIIHSTNASPPDRMSESRYDYSFPFILKFKPNILFIFKNETIDLEYSNNILIKSITVLDWEINLNLF